MTSKNYQITKVCSILSVFISLFVMGFNKNVASINQTTNENTSNILENDKCENALPYTVFEENECLVYDNFITEDISNNSSDIKATDCFYYLSKDMFYSFEVPSTGQVKLNMPGAGGLAIYDGCNGNSLFCRLGFSYSIPPGLSGYIVTGLPAGETVIAQLIYVPDEDFYGYVHSNSEEISFCISKHTPTPTTQNDMCTNALPIDIGEAANCFKSEDISKGTVDISPIPGCSTTAVADLYYSFKVPSTGRIKLQMSSNDVGCAIFSSCSGNQLYCNNYPFINEIIRDLPVGENVILQFFNNDDRFFTTFSFCISTSIPPPPPVNDICENAIPLEVKKKCYDDDYISIDFTEANFEEDISTCNNQNNDVFFTTIIPANGIINVKADDGVSLTIYDECLGNQLACKQRLDRGYKNDSNVFENLPANQNVLLQFSTLGDNSVSFCIEEAEKTINNNCNSASFINVNEPGQCNYIEIDNVANDLSIDPPPCDSNTEVDVFYKFVVPASGKVKISGTLGFGVTIYDSCLSNAIYCAEEILNDDYYYYYYYDERPDNFVENLTPFDTLTLQLFQSNKQHTIEFCLEDMPPTANNTCENAEQLTVYEEYDSDNLTVTNLFGNYANITPVCYDLIGADIFYKFTVPNSGQVILWITSRDKGFAIYDRCLGESITCDYEFNYDASYEITNLPAGEEVILQLFQKEKASYNIRFTLYDNTPIHNCTDEESQLDIDIVPKCSSIGATKYSTKLIVNNLGLSPSGYTISGFPSAVIDQLGTFYVPYKFNNGTNKITFNGIDNEHCLTKTFDFTCENYNCDEEIIHENITIEWDYSYHFYQSAGFIRSNANIINRSRYSVAYRAEDSVILNTGFSVDAQSKFSVDIEDCK